MTPTPRMVADSLVERLGDGRQPVGFRYEACVPDGALQTRTPGRGCVAPFIHAASKGRTVAFTPERCGWPCSAFYLGYSGWIFDGIERYLSTGPCPGRECERFVRTPAQARSHLESVRFRAPREAVAVFRPLAEFAPDGPPEVVIFFAAPDQLSALVLLLHFDAPEREDCIVARFASACAAMVTLPLAYVRDGVRKAVWGLHDISARVHLPRDVMTLALPWPFLLETCEHMEASFLYASPWEILRQRSLNSAKGVESC